MVTRKSNRCLYEYTLAKCIARCSSDSWAFLLQFILFTTDDTTWFDPLLYDNSAALGAIHNAYQIGIA